MTFADWLTIAGLVALVLLPFVALQPTAKPEIYICVGYCPVGAR